MAIKCYRFGTWSGVKSTATTKGRIDTWRGVSVDINFSTGGAYRGTSWRVEVSPGSFAALAKAMVEVNRDAAAKAFDAALSQREQSA